MSALVVQSNARERVEYLNTRSECCSIQVSSSKKKGEYLVIADEHGHPSGKKYWLQLDDDVEQE